MPLLLLLGAAACVKAGIPSFPPHLVGNTSAIAALLEESGFGSSAAAPLVRSILEPIALDEVPRARTTDELDRLQVQLTSEALDAAEEDGE